MANSNKKSKGRDNMKISKRVQEQIRVESSLPSELFEKVDGLREQGYSFEPMCHYMNEENQKVHFFIGTKSEEWETESSTPFEKTIKEVRKLNENATLVQKNFISASGSLSETFRWIMKAELENKKQCHFSVRGFACSNSKAKELKVMGFTVEEVRDERDVLTGWNVSWDNLFDS